MKIQFAATVTLLSGALAACGGSTPAREQLIQGQAELATFPGQPATIQALRGTKLVAEAPIGSDGSFSLLLAPGSGYHMQFVSEGAAVAVVFPRSIGSIDNHFDIRVAEKAFDLGKVRYVGDPAAQSYIFGPGSSDPAVPQSGDEINCEDGIDTATGAVCVDDEDEEGAGACEEDGEADDGGVDCEDGIDTATGLECDGGPSANTDDGSEGEEGSDEAQSSEASVPDHNLPSAMGCAADDEEEGGIDCQDGIDPATGLECDGGPSANTDDGE